MASAEPAPLLLGRYRVRRFIKRGGIAEVFEASAIGENGFERSVAIKRLLPDHASDESVRRAFLDEARIASRLSHANIVAILDFGLADGLPFQVLELIEGGDIGSLAAESVVPPLVALQITSEIALALEYAHGAVDDGGEPLGIVHRDVTPQNILVSWKGAVKLGDFGVARARARLEATNLGIVKGTLAYMAPEQARASAVDGRADIYALGCVLHRLIAGKSPLHEEAERMKASAGGTLELDPSVPDEIGSIILRATRPRREERYPHAGAMAEECWKLVSRQADRDVRKMLREWLLQLRTKQPAEEDRTDVLFELEFAKGAEESSGFKQYTAVAPRPLGEVDILATTLIPSLAPVVPADSVSLAPPPPTPIIEISHRPAVSGRRYAIMSVAAVLIAATGFVAGSLVNSGSAPDNPIRPIEAPIIPMEPAMTTEPSVTPRDTDDPPDDEGVDEKDEPEPSADRTQRRRRAVTSQRSFSDLHALLERRMRTHRLTYADLEQDDRASANLALFRASSEERQLEVAERALSSLSAAMPTMATTPAVVERRLRRMLESLRSAKASISKESVASLQTRYFELRLQLSESTATDERQRLLGDVDRLEVEIEQAASSAPR